MEVSRREAEVVVDGAVLSGSIWAPRQARAVVLMIPGSGPSTRDNAGYFPSIRQHLLANGFAAASFDKRGAGQSTGRLLDTGIEVQADDAAGCVSTLRALFPEAPVAAFGHSQGGWVAYELAARDPTLSAVVANSGPTVGVAEQERFRIIGSLDRAAAPDLHGRFDAVLEVAARGGEHAEALDATGDLPALIAELSGAGDIWPLIASMYSYHPEQALREIRVPTLCLFGSRERVVPVGACVRQLELLGNPYLDFAVLNGGDHRLLLESGDFAPGYHETLVGFLAASTSQTR